MNCKFRTIEFFGLPGSGKSTIVNNLIKEVNISNLSYINLIHNISKKNKLLRIVYKIYILIKELIYHPIITLKLSHRILKTKQNGILDYIKVLVNYFYIINIYRTSKNKNKKIILSQGIFQAIWSIAISAKNQIDIEQLIEGVELPDLVVIVKIDYSLMKKRLELRKGNQSRLEKRKYKEHLAFTCKTFEYYEDIIDFLKKSKINIIALNNNTHNQLNENTANLRRYLV